MESLERVDLVAVTSPDIIQTVKVAKLLAEKHPDNIKYKHKSQKFQILYTFDSIK